MNDLCSGYSATVLSQPVSEAFPFHAWESLVASSPTPLSLLDGDGSPRWCNPAFERLFDLSENITWNLLDLVEEDEADGIRAALERLVRGEATSVTTPARWCRLDGSKFDGPLTFELFSLESMQVVSAMIDHALPSIDSEVPRYRRALEDQQQVVCEWDEDGRIIYCNRLYRKLFEIGDAHNGVGRMRPHLGREQGAEVFELLRGGLKAHTNVCRRNGGGIVEWCDTAVLDADGAVVSVLSVGYDLTERINIEQSLRAVNQRLELMTARVRDSVLLISPDGTIVDSAGRPLAGDERHGKAVVAGNLFDLVHPDDAAAVYERVALVAREAISAEPIEVRLGRTDDVWSAVELDIENLLDEPGVAALVVTVRDITARNRISAELDRCRAAAEDAERQRAAFVANVSRELRNPLHSIVSTSELLTTAGLPATSAMLAGAMFRRTVMMQRTVDDLLEFQQIQLGAIAVVHQDVNLLELVDSAINASRIYLFPGVTIEAHHDARAPRTISSDRVRLASIMFHLVSNACKNTTHGTIAVNIAPSVSSDRVRIEVRDTGQGIAQGDLDRCFAPYERGHSDHAVGGLGLGLPIAKGLVEALGGTMAVSTKTGFGSVFWIELPVRPAVESQSNDDTTLRALVVEDDPINQMITIRQLEVLGVAGQVVPDGESALIRLETEHFDLLVLDVHLPGISGLEVARRFRRVFPRPYIAGISSASTAADRAACFEAGMDTFISKPATLDMLRPVIVSAGMHRSQQH